MTTPMFYMTCHEGPIDGTRHPMPGSVAAWEAGTEIVVPYLGADEAGSLVSKKARYRVVRPAGDPGMPILQFADEVEPAYPAT